jgi:hypothetical protein
MQTYSLLLEHKRASEIAHQQIVPSKKMNVGDRTSEWARDGFIQMSHYMQRAFNYRQNLAT